MIEAFVSAFVTLLVVIDPLGCAPIFAGLTSGTSWAHTRSMAIRSSAIASGILFLFAVLGEALLHALGISLSAFRIAGGIMLFLIALEMVFGKRTERGEDRAEEIRHAAAAEGRPMEYEDISVFPMGIPMIAGPGSIATVMLLTSRAEGLMQSVEVYAALAAVLLLTLAALLASRPIMRRLGASVEAVLTRLLGVLLAALAAQFVIDGVRQNFG